jgi:hypothetical protein
MKKRFWLDQEDRLFPRSNHSGQNHQEKTVCLPEARAFELSTKNDQLLP